MTSPTPDRTIRAGRPIRRLDRKLAELAAGRYAPDDFIIADAKDADMAWGLGYAGAVPGAPAGAPGAPAGPSASGPGRYRTRAAYLSAIRELAAQGELDVILTSASSGECLAREGSLGDDITLAVRANDTTDIWNLRGGSYPARPSRPFRTADLPRVREFCDLVLYSVTFNNDLDHDLATLDAYAAFRSEAVGLGIRYFLEVFNPNAPVGLAPEQVGAYVNDCIVRTLAGVTSEARPLFLKMAYNGANALAELTEHDPSLVVGILGGSAGTTRDTFELLHHTQAHGGRVALFGRRIQRAESQLDLVGLMRPVLRGEITPADAVRAYHDALHAAGLTPYRGLADDLLVTDPALRSEL